MRTLVFAILTALAASCDPVREEKIDELGGETPGVPRGPTHRAGQPCLVCHGEGGPEGPTMSVAGTVFRARDDRTGVAGAVVTLTDATGESRLAAPTRSGRSTSSRPSGRRAFRCARRCLSATRRRR